MIRHAPKTLLFTAILALISCTDESKRVRISLPLPPKLDLTQYDFLFLPGFVTDMEVESFDINREAVNFLRREVDLRSAMKPLSNAASDMSDKDPRSFFSMEQPYFRSANAELPNRTLALTGVLTFDQVDRSGFHEVERTDLTGRRVVRTQYVEVTGYILNMRVYVYELDQGRLLYREALSDSINVEGSNADDKLVFFDLMQRISDRVVGLFSNTLVRAERKLL